MKNLNKLVIGMLAVAGAAQAQNSEQAVNMVSATGVVTFEVATPANRTFVWLRGANAESATLIFRSADNSALLDQAVAIGTTYTSVTLPAPQYFTRVSVSPTTLTAADAISVTFIQARDVGIAR